MAVAFANIRPGQTLLDVRRQRMGNTTLSQWACWKVEVLAVDANARRALVSWNGNTPEWWSDRRLYRLYRKLPKAYREQEERRQR